MPKLLAVFELPSVTLQRIEQTIPDARLARKQKRAEKWRIEDS